MGLIGVMIASVVNIFLGSTALQFAISVIGILVFVGLTAWDTQSIKEQYAENIGAESQQKLAVFGAFSLYLNFINIFQLLLELHRSARGVKQDRQPGDSADMDGTTRSHREALRASSRPWSESRRIRAMREAEASSTTASPSQPGAPYYMAQTIVMQEAALTAAQARIEELEAEAEAAASSRGGGLLSGLFGAPARPPRSAHAMPQVARRDPDAAPRQAPGGPGGGGFLAGAAQTAMGVAGGVLLGNAIAGMFGGPAEAGEAPAEELEETGVAPGDAGELDDMDF